MRVAALYDIHGNLPALEAVLDEVRREGIDRIIVGGDVVPGPMPVETLHLLKGIDLPIDFICGNCELAVLAQMAAEESGEITYWGTTSGAPPPQAEREVLRWTADRLRSVSEPIFARWPKTFRLDIPRWGPTLFCHGTPRSETEICTRLTSNDRLRSLFDDVEEAVVVCGHTHMQFDRTIGPTRVVNAGSVGMPFGDPGAYWLLLGPKVEFRCTHYDVMKGADRVRATGYPKREEYARHMLQPPSEESVLSALEGRSGPFR